MPSAVGHHRSLNERRRPTWATTFPGLVTLRHYERAWLRGDLLAGVTVAAYLVPQVMAYAQIAGLPPAAGLVAVVGADPRRTPSSGPPASSPSAPSPRPPS